MRRLIPIKNAYLFCVPPLRYLRLPEMEAGVEYEHMAIDEYDELISFDKKYEEKYVETPDLEMMIGKKEDRNLNMIVFSKQPIIRIGDIEEGFTSSSYLINPESKLLHPEKGTRLMLPDMDIVSLTGEKYVREAIQTISKFYSERGWQTCIIEKELSNIETVRAPKSKRLNGIVLMPNPETMVNIVKTALDYKAHQLYFKPQK